MEKKPEEKLEKKNNIVKFPTKKKKVCSVCLGHGSYRVIGPRAIGPRATVTLVCDYCDAKGEVLENSDEKPT
jgi:DnaJ-class molecular chaperone